MSSHVLSLGRCALGVIAHCVEMADRMGVVPILSGKRFLDIRPGDAILSYVFFGMMLLLLVVCILWTFISVGFLEGLLAVVFAPPLAFLLTAFLLRLTLELLLLGNRK